MDGSFFHDYPNSLGCTVIFRTVVRQACTWLLGKLEKNRELPKGQGVCGMLLQLIINLLLLFWIK